MVIGRPEAKLNCAIADDPDSFYLGLPRSYPQATDKRYKPSLKRAPTVVRALWTVDRGMVFKSGFFRIPWPGATKLGLVDDDDGRLVEPGDLPPGTVVMVSDDTSPAIDDGELDRIRRAGYHVTEMGKIIRGS